MNQADDLSPDPQTPVPSHTPNVVSDTTLAPDSPRNEDALSAATPKGAGIAVEPQDSVETRFLKRAFVGESGIRAGWSVALFMFMSITFMAIMAAMLHFVTHNLLHTKLDAFSAPVSILTESIQLLGLLGAAAVSAFIEKRRILDYNLSGPNRMRHFVFGSVCGFGALSILVAMLFAGGWIRFGQVSLTGVAMIEFALMWGVAFLLTGFSEEGMVRCYLLFTLTRGVNYWWALGTVAAFSLLAFVNPQSHGSSGVYTMALLGVVPCLFLELRKSPFAGFWQAAWLTSTFFGFIHTFNDGESWLGIFSAASIGFVFCVSIRFTGSAWWAIGYHAAWDWAQTFFYGTPDSGFAAKGHFLTTTPQGAKLWSGGSDGPEGSVLVLVIILVTLIYLVAVYGRKRVQTMKTPSEAAQPQLS